MNRYIWICLLAALTLSFAACSKEESTPADNAAAVTDQAAETADDAIAAGEEASADTAESMVVVEESAAEEEPEDKTIVLAQAEEAVAARTWKYKEGQNFTRLVPTQPTVGGADKIEVAEIFMYTCPHCFDLEPHINQWAENKDPNVRFVRIPAMFNQLAQLHAQLYYTEVFLTQTGKLQDPNAFRNMVFEEIHRNRNQLNSEATIQRLFARAGVSEDDFKRTWSSFEVNQAMRVAADLARRYNVMSVPLVVVNGKFKTDASQAGSYPNLMEVINELTAREGLR